MTDLIKKYNRQGPRYTSYPPLPFWNKTFDESSWISHIKKSYDGKTGLDLYVHVPFCERLCYYCGCNRQVTRNHKIEESFVETLLSEWNLYIKKMGFVPRINSLHFGGGTPTFLSPLNLKILISALTMNRSADFKGSIEIDPRTVSIDHLDMLVECGFKRFSLGIQDFDQEVQKSINRFQSYNLVKNLVDELRLRNIESLNFDVIYGLPKQTTESITETFRLISLLEPDQIAFYSYAHLPDKLVNQRLINAADLPQGEQKALLYETGKELLIQSGFHDVGMDHFAKENNFLYQAKLKNNLHRNFMGYVDKKSSVLIGLGPSSISDSSLSFVQNSKTFSDYERMIQDNKLALVNGHGHDTLDLMTQKLIIDLMCNEAFTLNTDLPHYDQILLELEEFEKDGIILVDNMCVKVLPAGKKFIRNIAMTFDFHFRQKTSHAKFSQTI